MMLESIFFRLLAKENKVATLGEAIVSAREGQTIKGVTYPNDPERFRQVPGSPFAYEDVSLSAGSHELIANLVSFLLGCAVGHWDVRSRSRQLPTRPCPGPLIRFPSAHRPCSSARTACRCTNRQRIIPTDRSLAIAHGLEELYQGPPTGARRRGRAAVEESGPEEVDE